jgi:hypothetical protein
MTAIVVLGVFASIALLVILRGFALSVLWGWFLTPLGLPEIGLAHAIGIALVVAMLTSRQSDSEDKEKAFERLFQGFLVPLIALLFGWIIHAFFM